MEGIPSGESEGNVTMTMIMPDNAVYPGMSALATLNIDEVQVRLTSKANPASPMTSTVPVRNGEATAVFRLDNTTDWYVEVIAVYDDTVVARDAGALAIWKEFRGQAWSGWDLGVDVYSFFGPHFFFSDLTFQEYRSYRGDSAGTEEHFDSGTVYSHFGTLTESGTPLLLQIPKENLSSSGVFPIQIEMHHEYGYLIAHLDDTNQPFDYTDISISLTQIDGSDIPGIEIVTGGTNSAGSDTARLFMHVPVGGWLLEANTKRNQGVGSDDQVLNGLQPINVFAGEVIPVRFEYRDPNLVITDR